MLIKKQISENVFVVEGDLLKDFDKHIIDAFAHGCNCKNSFGAGIAKSVKEKYPYAYAQDCIDFIHSKDLLGHCGFVEYSNNQMIFNLYTQYYYGVPKFDPNAKNPPFDEIAFKIALQKMHDVLKYHKCTKIGFPRIGSGLGGGDESTIENIIVNEFKHDDSLVIYIYDYKG